MADLIDRQAAIDALNEKCMMPVWCKVLIEKMLKDQPSAQPEIIRCKECKHLFDGEHNVNCCELLMEKAKWITEVAVDDNWYCADGERITDE